MSLNPGIFNSYLWQDQTILSTYTTDSTGSYWVTVTDNNGCTASDTMQIISMLTVPKDFLPGDTSICNYGSVLLKSTGTFKNYLWSTNSMNQNITIQNAGEYWLKVTDNNNCKGSDTIVVSPKECLKGFFIPTAFTPNGDGKNDHLKPLLFGNVKKYHFVIYNRWGEIVFETSDLTKGWDGTVKGMKQESAVYVWLCNYQFEGEELRIQKGTVLLIQ
jgi:gliding motility-associated-like protein